MLLSEQDLLVLTSADKKRIFKMYYWTYVFAVIQVVFDFWLLFRIVTTCKSRDLPRHSKIDVSYRNSKMIQSSHIEK